ncbi:MAG: alpha/beta fold hydrolase [Candidatus Dormibacter sp.]
MGLYSEAIHIASGFKDLDGPNVNPACHTRLYTHGHRTERSLVLLHGFTSCPQQFDDIGRMFHAQGWNVLIPRYPRHGYSDRLNTSISELRAEHLVAMANRSADAAHGLGQHVTVAGVSLGGALAGHLGQTHEHIDRAVLIAPALGSKLIPGPVFMALGRVAYILPNFYVWWDPRLKEKLPPTYGYPRYSTHAYGALLNVASGVTKAARTTRPKARELVVVTNANEPGLENRFTYELIQAWRSHGANVTTHVFPRTYRLPHDLLDPANPDQNTEHVYPLVSKLISG